MDFTTSMDEIVRKRKMGFALLFFSMPFYFLAFGMNKVFVISCFVVFMAILLFTYLKKTVKYSIDKNSILICRRIGNVEINIKDIGRVDKIHHDLIKKETKGGAFGYVGQFDTEIGRTHWFTTRRDQLVLITKKDGTKIILSPDMPYEFIKQVDVMISC